MKKGIVLLALSLLPLIIPFIKPGFFTSDDGEWMVIRLSAFHETLKTGQFPVRFLERLYQKRGYPVTNFLYPLPFYLGEAIHLTGFGFIDSTKILFALSLISGALGTYFLSGTLAAIIYSYHPYHIFDIYQRGSLGEVVALGILPWILVFKKNTVLSAIFWAALICSHNTLGLIFTPIILLFNKNLKSLLIALGLSAFFWIPALYELQYTKASLINVADYHQYFLNFALVGIALPFLIFFARGKILAISLIALFLASPLSSPLWQTLPLPKIVQFPWRFLSILVLTESLIIKSLPKKLAFILVLLTIITTLITFKYVPLQKDDAYYYTNDDSTTVKNEYANIWLNEKAPILPGYTRINKMYFPGVKLLVDNKETSFNYKNSGLIEAKIPSGNHTVKTVYSETLLRLIADLISAATLAASICLPLLKRCSFKVFSIRQ